MRHHRGGFFFFPQSDFYRNLHDDGGDGELFACAKSDFTASAAVGLKSKCFRRIRGIAGAEDQRSQQSRLTSSGDFMRLLRGTSRQEKEETHTRASICSGREGKSSNASPGPPLMAPNGSTIGSSSRQRTSLKMIHYQRRH